MYHAQRYQGGIPAPGSIEVAIVLKEEDHCSVRASDLLRSVFSNIVSNAVKHSTGAVNIFMTLSPEVHEGKSYVRVSIEDNGPGIPNEMKDKSVSRGTPTCGRRGI